MNESLQCFQSEGEFTKSERSFSAKTSALEPLQVLGQRVFRPVDDPEVFSPSNLNGRLREPFPSLRHKLQWLYHYVLAATCHLSRRSEAQHRFESAEQSRNFIEASRIPLWLAAGWEGQDPLLSRP